jgi:hypothetical protein
MSILFQDIVATALALGAVASIVYRVAGLVRPAKKSAGCSSCPSCQPTPDASKPIEVRVVSRS